MSALLPEADAIKLAVVPQAAPPYDGSLAVAIPYEPGEQPARLAVHGAGRRAPGSDWAIRFAHLLAEALAGFRPARQLASLTTERARVHLRTIGTRLHCEQRPQILRVITTRPDPDVMEMTVIAGFGTRTRAVAVRFERTKQAPADPHAPAVPRRPTPPAQPASPARPAPARPTSPARWLCTDIEAA